MPEHESDLLAIIAIVFLGVGLLIPLAHFIFDLSGIYFQGIASFPQNWVVHIIMIGASILLQVSLIVLALKIISKCSTTIQAVFSAISIIVSIASNIFAIITFV